MLFFLLQPLSNVYKQLLQEIKKEIKHVMRNFYTWYSSGALQENIDSLIFDQWFIQFQIFSSLKNEKEKCITNEKEKEHGLTTY